MFILKEIVFSAIRILINHFKNFFLQKWVLLFTFYKNEPISFFSLDGFIFLLPKELISSPLLATFPKTLALPSTWEVKDRDWEGATHELECQGGQRRVWRDMGLPEDRNLVTALPIKEADREGGGRLGMFFLFLPFHGGEG